MVRVMRYLKYTLNYGMHYIRYPTTLERYSDTNWISDTNDTKSTSRYVFRLVVQLYLGNLLNKHALQGPQWNQNLSLWIKQEKKQSGFVISWRIMVSLDIFVENTIV